MSEKLVLNDLPTNLIAFIYQFLPEKDMVQTARCSKKFNEALEKDFLMEQLAKRDLMFLPEDEVRGETWKDIFKFLKAYKVAEKSGRSSKFRAIPYRGHTRPIEAFCALENKYNFNSTIVSGDGEGNVYTWNEEVDEDDEDEKEMKKDLIFKADSSIKGISKFNDDRNMIVWTTNNKFYIYDINLFDDKKFDKNSKRFELKSEFSIEKDDKIEQVFYDKNENQLFLSGCLGANYTNTLLYSYNLQTLTLEIYNFGYDNIQSEFINKDESNQANPQPQPQPQILPIRPRRRLHHDPFFDLNFFLNDEEEDDDDEEDNINNININNDFVIQQNHETSFVLCNNKLILFINYEPVKKKLICKYNCKKLLPNAYFIDKETKLYKDLHVDLEYIYNIIKIAEDKVGFIGVDTNKMLMIKIYSTENPVLLGEKILHSNAFQSVREFSLLYSDFPKKQELYYLIDHKILYKMNLANLKQITDQKIKEPLKEVNSVNCIESDRNKIVMASDELYIAIFNITNGEFWYIFLGGSLTVTPKSFVKHPLYKGFHIMKITRNAIICAQGNLIREYRYGSKKK